MTLPVARSYWPPKAVAIESPSAKSWLPLTASVDAFPIVPTERPVIFLPPASMPEARMLGPPTMEMPFAP